MIPAGIARCFTYGGSKNSALHDPRILPRDNLSKEKYMSKEEKQTSINHFHEKLFKLKDMMKTEVMVGLCYKSLLTAAYLSCIKIQEESIVSTATESSKSCKVMLGLVSLVFPFLFREIILLRLCRVYEK